MMNITNLVLLLLSVLMTGVFVVQQLQLRNIITNIGLSFLFGSMVTTYAYFNVFLITGSDFSKRNLQFFLIFIVIMFLSYFFISKRKITIIEQMKTVHKHFISFSLVEKIFCSLIVIMSVFVLGQNFIWPVTKWDAITLYDFRGKVISSDGLMAPIFKDGYYLNYPPYTSLLHAFMYSLDIKQVHLWYAILYISFILVFYSLVREKQNRMVSLFAAFLLAINPAIFDHSLIAYTNLSQTVFLGLGVIYLWQWIDSGKRHQLWVGGICVAMSTWIRNNDPLYLIGVVLIIVGLIKHKKDFSLGLLLSMSIIFVQYPWNVYKSLISSEEASGFTAYLGKKYDLMKLVRNSPAVIQYVIEALKPYVGSLFILAFFATIYDIFKRRYMAITYFLTILLMLLIIMGGTFMLSVTYDWWNEIPGSVGRLSMVFIPLFIYITCISSIWNWKLPKYEKKHT